MRKLLAAGVCALFLSQPITTLGQATIGTIVFANRNIPTAANDGSTYNVPIYQCNMAVGGVGGFQGAGSLPGGVTVGLFTQGSATPFATAALRTDANSMFFGSVNGQGSSLPVEVPGSTAGQQVLLTVRAWTTASGSFDAARTSPSGQWWEGSFLSKPLGGTPAGGGLPITNPGMTGWGTENGAGFELFCLPEPSTAALGTLALGALLALRRRR
jgi:hypothetical protein